MKVNIYEDSSWQEAYVDIHTPKETDDILYLAKKPGLPCSICSRCAFINHWQMD